MKNYKDYFVLIISIFIFFGCSSSSTANTETVSTDISLILVSELAFEVEETSGLLKVDGKLYTHNDSGDTARLYEIDVLSGAINRTIIINGADNVDWEDLASDDTHVYIGDFGNNLGSRSDLKIYKILKTDLASLNVVNAEIISFSYADQSSYVYAPFTTPYDAESLIVYEGQLYIFTKNWADYKTKVYALPINAGNYIVTASSEKSFDVLITGATIDTLNNTISLIGYTNPNDINTPFKSQVIVLDNFTGDDFFSGTVVTHDILNSQTAAQVEAIAFDTSSRLYISAEGVSGQYAGKLYEAFMN